ncbi:MAG: GNAT family N-acetyltransferase [Clostridia bacterium]|nr:GNAT family N-acetyltransferase [Clostridia bacterium]
MDDTNDIVRWRNSADVKSNLFSQAELTVEQHTNYFKSNVETGKCHQFIIVADERSVGTAFLKNIDYLTKTAEFGIFIGESFARGRGYAAPVTEMIVDYGFDKLCLEKITLSVFADNLPAIKAYKKAGFVEEKIRKNAVAQRCGSTDVLIMSITRDKWKA